jgi:hypothetical protein
MGKEKVKNRIYYGDERLGAEKGDGGDVRNFPCQTLKISKVSIVVMGSQRYALPAARPRPAYRPPGLAARRA